MLENFDGILEFSMMRSPVKLGDDTALGILNGILDGILEFPKGILKSLSRNSRFYLRNSRIPKGFVKILKKVYEKSKRVFKRQAALL